MKSGSTAPALQGSAAPSEGVIRATAATHFLILEIQNSVHKMIFMR